MSLAWAMATQIAAPTITELTMVCFGGRPDAKWLKTLTMPNLPVRMDERVINRTIGIIDSMTRRERAKPEIIKASRKRRIASGSGVSVQEVNRLLSQFAQMQKMMKMMGKGGLQKMMRGVRGMFPGIG